MIQDIPIFDNSIKEKYRSCLLYTNINHKNIENKINRLLDKHQDICKYYINIEECYWIVSFNVGIEQVDAMIKTMFEIRIFKNNEDNINIYLSKEIEEHQQWNDVLQSLKNLQFI